MFENFFILVDYWNNQTQNFGKISRQKQRITKRIVPDDPRKRPEAILVQSILKRDKKHKKPETFNLFSQNLM